LASSKRLTYRKKELKVTDVLGLAATGSRQLISGNIGITLKQLVEGSLETYKARWIDTVSQVKPDWPYGGLVADAEADCVDHVIEVLEIALAHAKGEAAEVLENIPHIVEDDAVDVIAE